MNLECSHTLCQLCISQGRLCTCPTCRHPIEKRPSQLSPNFALIEALELRSQAQALDAVALSGKIGISGDMVLDPCNIHLVRKISTVGVTTGVVWEGTLFRDQKVSQVCAIYSLPYIPS